MNRMAPITPKYRKLLTGFEKSGNSPESVAVAILSILCFIMPFVITIHLSSIDAPSDSATKYYSDPLKVISSSSCSSFKGDTYSGSENFIWKIKT